MRQSTSGQISFLRSTNVNFLEKIEFVSRKIREISSEFYAKRLREREPFKDKWTVRRTGVKDFPIDGKH